MKTRLTMCLVLAVCLPGCAGSAKLLDNRLVTTVAGDRAFVASMYGPIGITSELSAADAAELLRLRALGKGAANAQ